MLSINYFIISTSCSFGYGETANGEKVPAYFVISKLTTGQMELVEFGSLYSIRAKKIAEDSTQGSPGFQVRTSATISIAKLLDIVNNVYSDILPKSVAEHYGVERRNTKLSKSVRYSLSENKNIAPVKGGIYGKDILLAPVGENVVRTQTAPREDIVPVRKDVKPQTAFPDNLAPVGENVERTGVARDATSAEEQAVSIKGRNKAKLKAYETERSANAELQKEAVESYNEQITNLQAE